MEEAEECKSLTQATVDFSNQGLRKIERATAEHRQATTLLLNDNEVQRLDNVDSYCNLKKLSLTNNQLVRMYGISQLIHLEVLDLTNNSLVTIEGLKELRNLSELYLGKNKIKAIEHINNNVNLIKLDISDNNVAHLTDISFLVHLKELHLHGNKLTNIRQSEKYFPENLQVLTLHDNLISDLNEVSHLIQFSQIKELTFSGNPCVNFSNGQKAFNYRPFIKNWCSSLLVLDNEPLDDIECLKAEWLYSQGRGRSFRPGEQAALTEYLASVCPAKEPNDETEDVKKLKLILSKAQQHQKQLNEQLSTGNLPNPKGSAHKMSRRKKISGLPERMVTSYQDCTYNKNYRNSPDLMTKSLDSGIGRHCPGSRKGESHQTPLQTSSTFIPIPDALISPDVCQKGTTFLSVHPRPASLSSRTSKSSSRNSPHSTPESKRKPSATSVKKKNEHLGSPLLKNQKLENSRSSTPVGSQPCAPSVISNRGLHGTRGADAGYRGTSDEDDYETIEMSRCQQKRGGKKSDKTSRDVVKGSVCLQKRSQTHGRRRVTGNETRGEGFANSKAWNAALCIQRWWRGYRARNLDGRVVAVFKDIQMIRMQEYISKVIGEIEATKMALEGNRRLQVLQMQAINALWKKLVTFQSNEVADDCNDSRLTLQQLMTTCSNLNKQVEGLQAMMKTLHSSSQCRSAPIATQTDIVAVHTPQGGDEVAFPYLLNVKRVDQECCSPSDPCGDSSRGSDIVEIYTTNNLEGSFSDQEILWTHHLEIGKRESRANVESSEPLAAPKEIMPDVSGSEMSERISAQSRLDDSKDVGTEDASAIDDGQRNETNK